MTFSQPIQYLPCLSLSLLFNLISLVSKKNNLISLHSMFFIIETQYPIESKYRKNKALYLFRFFHFLKLPQFFFILYYLCNFQFMFTCCWGFTLNILKKIQHVIRLLHQNYSTLQKLKIDLINLTIHFFC
jgi:hypothetical protein